MRVTVESKMPLVKQMVKAKMATGLRMMADDVVRESGPHTPKDTGDLRNTTRREVLGLRGRVEWTRGYAIYQESGHGRGPILRYTTPGTGPHFARNAVKKVSANSNKYFI